MITSSQTPSVSTLHRDFHGPHLPSVKCAFLSCETVPKQSLFLSHAGHDKRHNANNKHTLVNFASTSSHRKKEIFFGKKATAKETMFETSACKTWDKPRRPRKTHIGISVVYAKINMPKASAKTCQHSKRDMSFVSRRPHKTYVAVHGPCV